MMLKQGVMLLLTLLTLQGDATRHLQRHHHHQGEVHHHHREHLRRRSKHDGTLPTPVTVREEPEEGIPVGEALAALSQCPPPIQPFHQDLCGVPACLHHYQCPQSRLCCFNGCVRTCLLGVESPPVIDWVEDTSAVLPILEESGPPELPVRYEDLSYAEGREEEVHLPGGCTISASQFSQLQIFMNTPRIENCTCEQGEVVCAVNMLQL
nr:uncharacterized protein LOC123767582 [Procambarus clarkii]